MHINAAIEGDDGRQEHAHDQQAGNKLQKKGMKNGGRKRRAMTMEIALMTDGKVIWSLWAFLHSRM